MISIKLDERSTAEYRNQENYVFRKDVRRCARTISKARKQTFVRVYGHDGEVLETVEDHAARAACFRLALQDVRMKLCKLSLPSLPADTHAVLTDSISAINRVLYETDNG